VNADHDDVFALRDEPEPDEERPMDDYDLFSPEFLDDPAVVWDAVRHGGCPVAHSDRWGGSWMPVRYDDITGVARDAERFSSQAIEVSGPIPTEAGGLFLPPLTSDPPDHEGHRRLLLPMFAPNRIAELEPLARSVARSAAEALAERGGGDAVADFAQAIPIAILQELIGVPAEFADQFQDWIVRFLRIGPRDQAVRAAVVAEFLAFFTDLLAERTAEPGDDLISFVAHAEIDGKPLSQKHKLGSCALFMIAGADTTWSALGASLWHLATHSEDRARLLAEPELMDGAVEELLRVYAPVATARLAKEDVGLGGRDIPGRERVLLLFAAANRDPAVFEDPHTVDFGRRQNRHLAFGAGVHRCLGSNLARMELRVGLEEWLQVIPDFYLTEPDTVRWTGGQVRGPESLQFKVRP
jgi:cytochrome P450